MIAGIRRRIYFNLSPESSAAALVCTRALP